MKSPGVHGLFRGGGAGVGRLPPCAVSVSSWYAAFLCEQPFEGFLLGRNSATLVDRCVFMTRLLWVNHHERPLVTEVSPSVSRGSRRSGDPPVVYLISADLGGSQTFFALHRPR